MYICLMTEGGPQIDWTIKSQKENIYCFTHGSTSSTILGCDNILCLEIAQNYLIVLHPAPF